MSCEVQYPAYPWERINGVAGPNFGMRAPCRPPMNHGAHRKSYFIPFYFWIIIIRKNQLIHQHSL